MAVTVREHPAHAPAWRWFADDVRGRGGAMALAPQVLAEFSHVVTDSRRFERPLVMEDALALASRWWHARGWEFDADEALLRRDDGVLTVRPAEREGPLPWLASLGPLDVREPDVDDRDLPPLDEPDV